MKNSSKKDEEQEQEGLRTGARRMKNRSKKDEEQ